MSMELKVLKKVLADLFNEYMECLDEESRVTQKFHDVYSKRLNASKQYDTERITLEKRIAELECKLLIK